MRPREIPDALWLGLAIICASITAPPAQAQPPELINYQGRLIDGTNLVNATVELVFQLYDAPTAGVLKYTEAQTVTVVDGFFSAQIGASNTVPGALKQVLMNGDVYLQTVIAGVALSPRERLTSVPYATVADTMPDGAVTSAMIEDQSVRNSDISPTAAISASKIADGAGSGLDADLLDGVHGAGYLRSDTSDTFTGSTLTFDSSATLDVNGTLNVETLRVGRDSTSDDDFIYFDANAEYIKWDNADSRFEVSDSLYLVDPINVGISPPAGISYNTIANNSINPVSGEMTSDGDLFIQFDLEVGDDVCLSKKLYMEGSTNTNTDADQTIYFYEDGNRTGESLRWNDADDWFEFSDSLKVEDSAVVGGAVTSGSFISSDSFISSASFIMADSWIYTRSDMLVGYGDSTDDDVIYFDGSTDEWLFWDNSASRFVFSDDLAVAGTLSKSAGSFKIDHPLDPANKYLNHSFVESPDMKNIYDGVVQLDASGEASVTLPEWFEALNRDFRYQLTPIGAPGPNLHVSQEVKNNQFGIAGGRPGLKVSWQVTGIRQDAYANAHRIPVEEDKPADEQGSYIHPELFGSAKTAVSSALAPSRDPDLTKAVQP